ncbi:enoyl-CoA hydratase/carnithine racemase [Bartonella fuyuanensis]|uniref:Enoyl-CoA hydratase/carnithine racemase n=1 Tax=Bartonella fuyuanensis TaxID=1460968 RepID=A0A840E5J1_9HYPH|nr:enoyl-CoA hydratase/carnithine racemase [Bartonella fuyuanensis]
MQINFEAGDDISFTKEGCASIIKLTGSSALNALNQRMVFAFKKAFKTWETDNDVSCSLIEGDGRAFCTGGMEKIIFSYQYLKLEMNII